MSKNNIALALSTLQEPTAFDTKTFDEILEDIIELAKPILKENEIEWQPIDSDPYMKKLRVLALRGVVNENYIKETVKQLLITTATGADLDNLGIERNVIRDQGMFPYADFEFKLEEANDKDIIIPAGLVLRSSDDRYKAHSLLDTTIKAGDLSTIIRFELETYVKKTYIKTETLITDIPFTLEIIQLDNFDNGSAIETDERYRLRIIGARYKYNTAGSLDAYEYFTYESDPRIKDVSIPVDDKNVLDVNIYIASDSIIDDEMIQKVYDSCNSKYVRPIGDRLTVYPVEIISLDLVAEIQLFELYNVDEIDAKIKENFDLYFSIGEEWLKIDFIKNFYVSTNVYEVTANFENVIATNQQMIKINSINFTYVKAVL